MPVSTLRGANWGTWINLEGGVYAEPAAVRNADNRVQVFVQGGSNTLYSKWEQRNRDWVASWYHHEGVAMAGAPEPILGADGKIRVFYRTPDNHLEVITQNAVNGGFGQPERIVRNIGGDPAVTLNADGRIQVFFRGTDGALWYTRNQGVLYELYTSPASLNGEIFAKPSPILDGTGRIVVAVKGGSDTLYVIQEKASNDADTWEAFVNVTSGMPSRPMTVLDAASRVQIFYRGSDGACWRVGQSNDYDSFGSTASLQGAMVGRPAVALGQDGRINVFVKGASEGALWVSVQNVENDTEYSSFQSLAGQIGETNNQAVIANCDDLLYVFVQGSGAPKNAWLHRQTWG